MRPGAPIWPGLLAFPPAAAARAAPHHGPTHRADHLRARVLRRLRGDLEGAEHAPHAAQVGDERDPRHRDPGRVHRAGHRERRHPRQGPGVHRDRVRHDQRGRRLPGHRPHARDVQGAGAAAGGRGEVTRIAAVDYDVIRSLYIVAFSMFILGLRMVTSPKTARRGNLVAAIGMAVAVIATLLIESVGDYGLIALGIAIGTAVGIPAARQVKMTAMPQMVALFNGVGGGAVALISWAEYRHDLSLVGGNPELETLVPILFAAIIGSISFWGSNIAFGKLQEIIPGRPIQLPGQIFINFALLAVAVGCAVAIAAGTESQGLFLVILIAAALLGNMFVLPIGGADMPVVISLLNAFTGLSAAAAGI